MISWWVGLWWRTKLTWESISELCSLIRDCDRDIHCVILGFGFNVPRDSSKEFRMQFIDAQTPSDWSELVVRRGKSERGEEWLLKWFIVWDLSVNGSAFLPGMQWNVIQSFLSSPKSSYGVWKWLSTHHQSGAINFVRSSSHHVKMATQVYLSTALCVVTVHSERHLLQSSRCAAPVPNDSRASCHVIWHIPTDLSWSR